MPTQKSRMSTVGEQVDALKEDRMETTESWIRTVSGKRFDPLDPDPATLDIGDIAHALSNICRFTGHTKDFYSVAQHCCVVMKILREQGHAWEIQLEGLLHDATEAYLSDIARPIKISKTMGAYRKAETKLEKQIAIHFGLEYPQRPEIKQADLLALAMEARDLMGNPQDWEILKGLQAPGWPLFPWDPDHAKAQFMANYNALRSKARAGVGRAV